MTTYSDQLNIANEYATNVLGNTIRASNVCQLNQLIQYLKEFTENTQHTDFIHQTNNVNSRLILACAFVKKKMTEQVEQNVSYSSNDVRGSENGIEIKVNDEDTFPDWLPDAASNVNFNDVIGGGAAITAIREALVFPKLFPVICARLNATPSQSVLLYGPPGTGKSLIARATANKVEAHFFKASCAELTSKWVGGSEKLIKSLFEHARYLCVCVLTLCLDNMSSRTRKRQKY